MHQVLQRTRSAPVSAPREDQPRPSLLRSLFTVRRGLGLLALLIGAALGSQALHGLLFQGSGPAPATPAGADGRGDSGSSLEPALQPVRPPASPRAAARTPDRPASATQALATGRATRNRAVWREASTPPVRSPHSAPVWERPSRSRQGETRGPLVLVPPPPTVQAGPPPTSTRPAPQGRTAPPPVDASAAAGWNAISLSALDPSVGGPCSDTLSALPSDRLPEEAWLPLPGSGAAPVLKAEALEPTLAAPIPSGSPDRSAGSSSHSLQATRNTSCLLKQPAGRN